MAAAAAMDLHDRRLSVSKSSSSRISKVAKRVGASPPASAASSRPPATVVNADLSNFRRVVQQLTGTPPPSASSSPVRDITRPSRLQRFAPPPLRPLHRQQQEINQPLLQQQHQQQQHQQHLQQQHHQYMMQHEYMGELNNIQPARNNQAWLPTSSTRQFSPSSHYTQVADPNHNPAIPSSNPSSYPNPDPLMLSPQLLLPLRALAPGDSTWANPIDVTPSPRPVSNSASLLPPLLPLPSLNGFSHTSRDEASEWTALNTPSSKGNPSVNGQALDNTLHLSSSNGHPLLPSSSSHGHPLPSHAHALLPPSPAALQYPLPPFSPSTGFYPPSHISPHQFPISPASSLSWLPPWSPSPFPSPPPFSPGLFPPSPGFRPFNSCFSFHAPGNFLQKPP